jgi:hypothetical protein
VSPTGKLEYDFRDPLPIYARRSLTSPGEIGSYYASLVIPNATRDPPRYDSPPVAVLRASPEPKKAAATPARATSPRAALVVEVKDDGSCSSHSCSRSDPHSGQGMVVALPLSQTTELGIAWDKRSRRRVEAEKNKKFSARAKVHGWLPSLE